MTKAQDFLFELLTEELPPKALAKLEKALVDSVTTDLQQAELNFAEIHSFATPRRLALIIKQLDSAQADREVERKGPAINAAYDKEGNPTKAALGFAKSCGIELSQADTLKTEKGEWLYYKFMQPGQSVNELLPAILQKALNKLPIPKMMKWGVGEYEFIRPVHNVVMLYGKEIIPAEFYGLHTTDNTVGHRFHHPESFKVTTDNYVEALRKAYVIADYAERKALIRQQIQHTADQQKAKAIIPEALLDEVTAIVEWPVALVGSFPEKFLKVPKEALILSMETNQKYFALTDAKNNLLPHFILISNIESKDPKQVIAGNEKVTQARLADAEFFFETDKKVSLAARSQQLAHIVFQKQLGTLANKTQRVTTLAEAIAGMISADINHCKRAAELAKADLCTDMVGEFPELQGIMGRYYAAHDKETAEVALALDEQYMPRFSGDQLPESKVGQVLALAERIDTLVGIFGINKTPSGDKDPFGLRRATLGILRILIEKQLNLDLRLLVTMASSLYGDKLTNPDTVEQVLAFCQDRLKFWARSQGIQADVFDAVAAKNITNPVDFKHRLDAVNTFLQLPEAANLAMANKRVNNILTKQADKLTNDKIDTSLLTDPAEKVLAEQLQQKLKILAELDYQQSLTQLADLNQPIDTFFTEVMVMVDNEKLRNNRLALLKQLRELFLKVADISLLQG